MTDNTLQLNSDLLGKVLKLPYTRTYKNNRGFPEIKKGQRKKEGVLTLKLHTYSAQAYRARAHRECDVVEDCAHAGKTSGSTGRSIGGVTTVALQNCGEL